MQESDFVTFSALAIRQGSTLRAYQQTKSVFGFNNVFLLSIRN